MSCGATACACGAAKSDPRQCSMDESAKGGKCLSSSDSLLSILGFAVSQLAW